MDRHKGYHSCHFLYNSNNFAMFFNVSNLKFDIIPKEHFSQNHFKLAHEKILIFFSFWLPRQAEFCMKRKSLSIFERSPSTDHSPEVW